MELEAKLLDYKCVNQRLEVKQGDQHQALMARIDQEVTARLRAEGEVGELARRLALLEARPNFVSGPGPQGLHVPGAQWVVVPPCKLL